MRLSIFVVALFVIETLISMAWAGDLKRESLGFEEDKSHATSLHSATIKPRLMLGSELAWEYAGQKVEFISISVK